ncbi:MAG: diversity-generating retroelement protein Avd [bacterium]|nr:diversity-generating retroelement protein Avd [bacterium]
MLQDLVIFEKVYQLVRWLYPTVSKFPKAQRFVLGQQIENTALDILRGVIRANAERDKLATLKGASVDLDTLRILLRLSKDLEFLSVRQYGFAAEQVNEVGKLLGGWIKSNTR